MPGSALAHPGLQRPLRKVSWCSKSLQVPGARSWDFQQDPDLSPMLCLEQSTCWWGLSAGPATVPGARCKMTMWAPCSKSGEKGLLEALRHEAFFPLHFLCARSLSVPPSVRDERGRVGCSLLPSVRFPVGDWPAWGDKVKASASVSGFLDRCCLLSVHRASSGLNGKHGCLVPCAPARSCVSRPPAWPESH